MDTNTKIYLIVAECMERKHESNYRVSYFAFNDEEKMPVFFAHSIIYASIFDSEEYAKASFNENISMLNNYYDIKNIKIVEFSSIKEIQI